MSGPQLAAVSYLARYSGHTHGLYAYGCSQTANSRRRGARMPTVTRWPPTSCCGDQSSGCPSLPRVLEHGWQAPADPQECQAGPRHLTWCHWSHWSRYGVHDGAKFRSPSWKGSGMPQYKVVELREGLIGGKMSGEKLEKVLNEHGSQCWVLKSITAVEVKGRM